jgi:hypothetical protein
MGRQPYRLRCAAACCRSALGGVVAGHLPAHECECVMPVRSRSGALPLSGRPRGVWPGVRANARDSSTIGAVSNTHHLVRSNGRSSAERDVHKRTFRMAGIAYASQMKSRPSNVPSCPNCRSVKLRNTPPTRTGCYRVCNDCNHLWHVTAETLRELTTQRPSRQRTVPD